MWEPMSVLLLNASLQPLNVISRRRLVVLLTRERVAFFDEAARRAVEADLARRCLGDGVIVVRLLRNIAVPRRLLRPNRRNLLIRDDYTCQYCGWQGPAGELTIDHIVPVSRGGASRTWENQVVACRRCNSRKANHLAHEVHVHLRRPARPVAHEYAHLLFLRHPEVRPAYEALLRSALVGGPAAAPVVGALDPSAVAATRSAALPA